MRSLYYLGSFNPVHVGHLIVSRVAMERGGFDRLVFVPCYQAVHKRGLADYDHRRAMLVRATNWDAPRLSISDVEKDLHERGVKNYTLNTIRELKSRGETEVFILIGADTVHKIAAWKNAKEVLAESTFVVAERPGENLHPLPEGYPERTVVLKAPLVDTSSSSIRSRRAAGLTLHDFVPPGVEEYIEEHGLYANPDEVREKAYGSET